MPGGYIAELLAGCGYDWIVFDTEHSPVDLASVLSQLQAAAPYPVSAVVRPASNDTVLIKRVLDLGAQTLIVPYVQSAEEAKAAVAAMRYPPRGVRGVAGLTRASRFGRIPGYAARADEELCLIVQTETAEALAEIESIAVVDGVDGIFVGPSDLSASLGYPGQPSHPDVVRTIEDAIARIGKAGKPAGILTPDTKFAQHCIDLGAIFVAVAVDTGVLARGAETLRRQFKPD